MKILGLTAPLSWNQASALLVDGKLSSFVEEERFNGLKHSPRILPTKSIEFCLKQGQLKPVDIDVIAIGFRHPVDYYLRSFSENLKSNNLIRGIREGGTMAEYYVSLVRLYEWLKQKGFRLSGPNKLQIKFIPHHQAHASSAYRCSGFDRSNIITVDGQGEDDSGSIWTASSGNMTRIKKISNNQSLGWAYTEVTDLLGFKPHSHEGKVMGLASWSKKSIKWNNLWEITSDGYHLKPNWQNQLWQSYGPRRERDQKLTDQHRMIAHGIQEFTEKAGVSLAKWTLKQNPSENIALAGGVALNCDMNMHILHTKGVKNIFIQPASNDAGTALGAAMEISHQNGESCDFHMKHAYWGPEFSNDEIEQQLKESKVDYDKVSDIETETAKILSQGKIVGWFQGRLEIGPRALGNRSILGHPGLKGMKDKINNEVKHREVWRPFAPSVLDEAGKNYFDNYSTHPYMILSFNTNKKGQKDLSQAIHVDKTARIQSVTSSENPRYHSLISKFSKISGIPALLNTSFNDSEQPLVCTPKEAVKTFYGTGLDYLAVGDFLLKKSGK